MNKNALLRFLFVAACSINFSRVYAQLGMPIIYADSSLQTGKQVYYNDGISGIQLELLRSTNSDSFTLIIKNVSRNNVCYLRTVENSRSHAYYSLGGVPSHNRYSDSVMQLHILPFGKFDSFRIALRNSDPYKIYLDLYLVPQGLLNILSEEGLGKMTTQNGRSSMMMRASLIDSLEGTEGIYRMIKISPVYRDISSGGRMVISTMKYSESNYTWDAFLTRKDTKGKDPNLVKHILLDSVRCVTVDHSVVYNGKHKDYCMRMRKDGGNGAKVKLSIHNTSKSAMGIIPPENLNANEYCEWVAGSYLILSGCYEALVTLKMLYLAPGEEIEYVVNVRNCQLFNFNVDLCLDVDRIASDKSGNKPTLELKGGRNYVEVPYSNDILETRGLFHSISIRNIGRDLAKSRPVVTVRGYQ